jgi:ABC-2 type transport system permease protein
MTNASIIAPEYTPTLGRTLTIYGKESKYEFLKLLRLKAFSLSTIGFPLMFYLIFGVANRHNFDVSFSISRYLLAGYCCFGMLGASLFGFGVGIANERGQGWLEVKQASPMPPMAYLVAKLLAAMAFSMIVAVLLIIMGITMAEVHVTAAEIAKLLLTNLVGAIPFCSMGMIIGLTAKANAAAGIVNLIYLPLSFCSGLWMPLNVLPKLVQRVAPLLPTYHIAQLSLHTVGYAQSSRYWIHWQVLVGFTLVCLGVAQYLMRHSESRA